jgi:hypothetical protein
MGENSDNRVTLLASQISWCKAERKKTEGQKNPMKARKNGKERHASKFMQSRFEKNRINNYEPGGFNWESGQGKARENCFQRS